MNLIINEPKEIHKYMVNFTLRELPGFVLNRMQYALLNECWRLIRDGVVTPQVSINSCKSWRPKPKML